MNDASSNVSPSAAVAGDVVELSLPLHARHASTARAVVASLAADAGFDVDEIDDLRLGVDEAVSVLLDRATLPVGGSGPAGGSGDRMIVRFEATADSVTVRIGCLPQMQAFTIDDLDELAVRILGAVVDRFDVSDGSLVVTKRTATRDGT